MPEITWEQFTAVELRAGTITKVEDSPKARKPAYRITAEFGPGIGARQTSAQLTALYTKDQLVGRQILAVLNFPPKQIGPVRSEFLLTGFYRSDGAVVLAVPEQPVEDGARLG